MTDQLVDAIAQRVVSLVMLQLQPKVQPRLLGLQQAADYLGRTPKAVRHLIATGAFPAVRADIKVQLDIRDLDRWIDQNKT